MNRRGLAQIRGAERREETVKRLGGNGDNFHMTWAADDRQFVALCDGYGFSDEALDVYNSRLFRISGRPENAIFEDVIGYPELKPPGWERQPRYYGFGTLALDGRIYQYLSTYITTDRFNQTGR